MTTESHTTEFALHRCLVQGCDYSTVKLANLRLHENRNHFGNFQQCSHCNYKTKNRANFAQHQVVHGSDKPFKCDICSFTCKYKRNMKSHADTHSKERPNLTCKICGFTTTHAWYFQLHKTIHTNTQPYQCKICSSGFLNLSTYEEHLSTKKHKLNASNFSVVAPDSSTSLSKVESNQTGDLDCVKVEADIDIVKTEEPELKIPSHSRNKPLKRPEPQTITLEDIVNQIQLYGYPIPIKDPTGNSSKTLLCEFCGSVFSTKLKLLNHLSHHLGDKIFACGIDDCSLKTTDYKIFLWHTCPKRLDHIKKEPVENL